MNIRALAVRVGALLGALLLALNCWGLLAPNDQRGAFPAKLLTADQALEQLKQLDPSGGATTVVRATGIIHQAMAPQWPKERARIPARQNWLLWLAGFFDNAAVSAGITGVPDLFSAYQMTDHRRALRRGFGICSQMALTLAGFLDELDYPTQVANLSGHVVLQVTLPDGSLMLADPHKGVTMDFGLDHAQANPDAVAAAYPPGSAVAPLYGPEGNQLVPGPASAYNQKLYLLEKISYYLIWIIPILLLIPFAMTQKKA